MSNSPFDPYDPLFPWYKPPATPRPTTPSFADLIRPAPKLDPNLLAGLIRPTPTIASELLAKICRPPRARIFVSYQHFSHRYYDNLFSQTINTTPTTIY